MTLLPASTNALTQQLSQYDALLVAFSGGVDSALLLAEALNVLGPARVLAVTAVSPTLPQREFQACADLAAQLGATWIQRPTDELANPAFVANDGQRCYHCKSALFTLCEAVVAEQSEPQRWRIAYGANQDDLGDHRPGMQAAAERGIAAPLLDAGWGKAEIRARSRELGLPTAEKAAFACLSSRFPTHTPIHLDGLRRVELAEEALRAAGFNLFRVRFLGDEARVELGVEELPRVLNDASLQQKLIASIEAAGFRRAYFDPNGYRQGGANKQ
ncbi:ATP-dependent sacrificial sulfur transferase LarE [Magnetofaba australis]|uniref:Putative adenosine nucleotide alpha-hydrolase superfamily protein n=1 Tax=Magnetofaba australis IT-1 TaxID=1434232 RepID=A0A1Y2JZI5_9PROT|nr:ATP-dependent sacrificial sulfur transferase LarE [Magnetofaba australis]OSM00317.1 putative adenosine nucleotide alpha-hydrolase superfamily protein [Magnetofaba australis IT-1]